MAKTDVPIDTISDTALWVAVYRAMETDRPDAIFKDPYARVLAGERGEEIVRTVPRGKSSAWAMITRTAILDEVLMRLMKEEQPDAVVNLAAGLDMRPYRLPLPPTLRWYEADLPGMIRHKEARISGEKPVCILERVAVDLSVRTARLQFFERLKNETKKFIVITEGLLVYLSADQVSDLARDLAAVPGCRYWLSDLSSPPLLKWANKTWGKSLQKSGSRMQFGPEEGGDFFAPFGFKCVETRSFLLEAARLKRQMPLWPVMNFVSRFYPKKTRDAFLRAGVVVLKRSDER